MRWRNVVDRGARVFRYTGDVILRGKTDVRVIAVELSVQVRRREEAIAWARGIPANHSPAVPGSTRASYRTACPSAAQLPHGLPLGCSVEGGFELWPSTPRVATARPTFPRSHGLRPATARPARAFPNHGACEKKRSDGQTEVRQAGRQAGRRTDRTREPRPLRTIPAD
jgi:hypothetical protein